MMGSPLAKGIIGGIAAAGLTRALTGGHHYHGGGFFGAGPIFGGGFGGYPGEMYEESYEEGYEEAVEDFGGGDFGDFGE